MRVDPKIDKVQVIVLAHVRELAAQIADVYTKLTKHSDIKVNNLVTSKKFGHIVISTPKKLLDALDSKKSMDLS